MNAAYRVDKIAMWWATIGRAIAVATFASDGGLWVNLALFEGVQGAMIAAGLIWESRSEDKKVKSV